MKAFCHPYNLTSIPPVSNNIYSCVASPPKNPYPENLADSLPFNVFLYFRKENCFDVRISPSTIAFHVMYRFTTKRGHRRWNDPLIPRNQSGFHSIKKYSLNDRFVKASDDSMRCMLPSQQLFKTEPPYFTRAFFRLAPIASESYFSE